MITMFRVMGLQVQFNASSEIINDTLDLTLMRYCILRVTDMMEYVLILFTFQSSKIPKYVWQFILLLIVVYFNVFFFFFFFFHNSKAKF